MSIIVRHRVAHVAIRRDPSSYDSHDKSRPIVPAIAVIASARMRHAAYSPPSHMPAFDILTMASVRRYRVDHDSIHRRSHIARLYRNVDESHGATDDRSRER